MADVSSYKTPDPVNPLTMVKDLGAIAQQKQTLDASKFDLAKKHYDTLSNEVGAIASDPNLNPELVQGKVQNLVKMGLLTPQQAAQTLTTMPTPQQLAQNPKALSLWAQQQLMRVQSAQQQFDSTFGRTQSVSDNAGTGFVSINPRSQTIEPAGGSAPYIPNRLSPAELAAQATVGVTGEGAPLTGTNRQRIQGADPALLNTPSPFNAPMPPRRPNALMGGQGAQAPVAPAQATARPTSAPTTTPVVPEGRPIEQPMPPAIEQRQGDLRNASRLSTGLQPLGNAISLLEKATPGAAGPTSEAMNQIKNFLVTVGAIDPNSKIANEAAARTEIEKYLNQQIAAAPGFSRSDASQAFAASSNPNLSGSVKAALQLSRTVYALNKMQAAMPDSFKSNNVNDYPIFAANWMAEHDPRAFGLDVMDKKEADKLITKMQSKDVINTPEGQKFWRSMIIAHKKK
jgi:hypothetical protein